MGGHKARMEEMSNAYTILVGKLGGKRSCEKRTRIWVHDVKADFKKVGLRVWVGYI
jgi:hypothetical protein